MAVTTWGCPVEFLVRIDIFLPSDMTEETRAKLFAAEATRAAILADEGDLIRLWRLPGRRSNWGLWQAVDANRLHESLTSLPLWKYMDVDVVALAKHPNDPEAQD